MTAAYYNENDKFAAAWLRDLIKAGLIMAGEVDERSIHDVQPSDLDGFTRCHFFAGIGGWDYALQLAGWPADRPVWTGSCPCQPFSSAGKGKGTDDERHLWPEFARLIGECRPATVFGEQVASKAGREWFDGVSTDLEGMGYAAAAADLCAASVNAPHIRQRLFWVADADSASSKRGRLSRRVHTQYPINSRDDCGLGNADSCRVEQSHAAKQAGQPNQASAWASTEAIACGDGKTRRIAPGITPLAHGVPGRVGLLRGYGNAIVPQVAAEFIAAYMETE